MSKYNREFIYSNIDKIMSNSQSIDKDGQIDIQDLLSEKFLREETKFISVEQIFSFFGKTKVNQKTFSEIDDKDWNLFIFQETKFDNWDEMLALATTYFMRNKLFAGIE